MALRQIPTVLHNLTRVESIVAPSPSDANEPDLPRAGALFNLSDRRLTEILSILVKSTINLSAPIIAGGWLDSPSPRAYAFWCHIDKRGDSRRKLDQRPEQNVGMARAHREDVVHEATTDDRQ